TARGTGVESGFDEDLAHRRAADRRDAQFLQLTENAGVAPTGVACDAEHQLADLLRRPRAPGPAVLPAWRGVVAAGAAEERSVRPDRDELLDGRPDLKARLDQPPPLSRSHRHPFGQLRPEHLVLSFEVLHLGG